MAPITRSSRHGHPAPQEEQSWPVPAESESDEPQDDFEEESDVVEEGTDGQDPFTETNGSIMAQAKTFRSPSATQLLRPLQQTADRVSRQVEEFAKCVDRFSTSRSPAQQEVWEHAWHLAEKYSGIAMSRKKQTSSELAASRSANRSRRGLQGEIEKAEEEIEQTQLEADLWSLLAGLIVCDSPTSSQDVEKHQKIALQDLHRYSTADEIWNAFLNSDQFAQECEEILGWLHKTAAASKTSIQDATASLRRQAQQGDGIFSAAWLFTKHSIKSQKQSRSWPKPLEPDDPGVKMSHARRNDNRPLLTQLDPDARSRQNHCLEPQDEYHEEAAWLACWEMLRRGYTPEQFREHCSEGKEFWRAASTGGVGATSDKDQSSSWQRIASIALRSEWAKRCYTLCQKDTDTDKYQSAVYGLLCGDPNSPTGVCKSFDDILFVCFNALLIQRYRHFIRAYRERLDGGGSTSYVPPPPEDKRVRDYMQYCQHDDLTKVECQKPQKMIEAAIVSRDYESFLLRQGLATAQVAEAEGHASRLFAADPNSPRDENTQAAAQDPEAVRFIAHLQLLLRSLGYLDETYKHNPEILDNNLACYIRWLQQEGKMTLIPLYASKLSPGRAARAMGSVLIDVTSAVERDLQVRLMKQYEISISNVLKMLYDITNAGMIAEWRKTGFNHTTARISEYPVEGQVTVPKLRSQFMGDEITDAEEMAVRSMEWFRYAHPSIWMFTCEAASQLYKLFISQGSLAAARHLAERSSLAKLSSAVLNMDLSSDDALTNDEDVHTDGVLTEDHSHSASPSKGRKDRERGHVLVDGPSEINPKALFAATTTWRQLEQLILALDSLEKWNELVEEVERHEVAGGTAQIRSMKRVLQDALAEVRAAMFPLLEEGYLSTPLDESEATVLKSIRNHYVSECVLAYNSVLYFAGHTITRSWLLECMNLAQVIATTKTLTNAFMESGRMRELVTAFALSSQALLQANQAGGKKGRKDIGLDIWQIKLPEA